MKVLIRQSLAVLTALIALFVLALLLFGPHSSKAASPKSDKTAALYKAKCVACHGADGSGNTPAGKKLKAGDLRSPKGDVYKIIAKGKGKMPGFEKSLGAEKVKALADYVKRGLR